MKEKIVKNGYCKMFDGLAGIQVSDSAPEQTSCSPNLDLSSVLGIFLTEVHGVDEEELKRLEEIKKRRIRELKR